MIDRLSGKKSGLTKRTVRVAGIRNSQLRTRPDSFKEAAFIRAPPELSFPAEMELQESSSRLSALLRT